MKIERLKKAFLNPQAQKLALKTYRALSDRELKTFRADLLKIVKGRQSGALLKGVKEFTKDLKESNDRAAGLQNGGLLG